MVYYFLWMPPTGDRLWYPSLRRNFHFGRYALEFELQNADLDWNERWSYCAACQRIVIHSAAGPGDVYRDTGRQLS